MVALDQKTRNLVKQNMLRMSVNASAELVLPRLVEALVPGGEHRGDEYTVRNPTRIDRRMGSFSINTIYGMWLERADSSNKVRGYDVISWLCYCRQSTEEAAIAEISQILESRRDLQTKVAIGRRRKDWTAISPVPLEVGLPTEEDLTRLAPRGFVPVIMWSYLNENEQLQYFVARFEEWVGGLLQTKIYLPISYAMHFDGRLGWTAIGVSPPAPLYNLPELRKNPDAWVVVVEGEKSTEAAMLLFPAVVVVTSAGGSGSPHKTDWGPFKGRKVLILPDADEAGQGYAHRVRELALQVGAASVRIVALPRNLPKGWDVADAAPEWFDLQRIMQECMS